MYDDDRYGGPGEYGRGAAGDRYGGAPFRSGYGRGPSDYDERGPSRYGAEDEYDFRSGAGGDWPGPGASWHEREAYYREREGRPFEPRGYGSHDRFDPRSRPEGRFADAPERLHDERPGGYDPYLDRDLLPPPPPRAGLGPAGRALGAEAAAAAAGSKAAESDDERDPEREAFEAELARVAAEIEKVGGSWWQCFLVPAATHWYISMFSQLLPAPLSTEQGRMPLLF